MMQRDKEVFASFGVTSFAQYQSFLKKKAGETMLINLQHFSGGMLCAPLCFGLLPATPGGLGFALARLGALCEAGWELEDTVVSIGKLLLGIRDPADVQILCVKLLHHVAGAMSVLMQFLSLSLSLLPYFRQ